MRSSDDLRDTAWPGRAVALAVENVEQGGGPFGALVVRDRALVASGVNRVVPDLDPTAHAEVVAICAACRGLGDFALAGAALYSSCEPCPLCLAAALWSRVDRVLYAASRDEAVASGFDDRRLSELFKTPPAEWLTPVTGLVVADAHAPFEVWAAKSDRVPY